MALENISAFARLAGVSRAAVYKAINRGRVIVDKNRQINTTNRLNADFLKSHKRDEKPAKSKTKPKRKTTTKPGSKPRPRPTRPKAKTSGQSLDLDDSEDGTTRSDAELQKTLAQITQIHVRTDKERQQLIDRDIVRNMLAKLSAIDVNELLTLGSNIAPEVAGLCGKEKPAIILKISKLIEDRCYRVLEHRQRQIKDFLEKMKAEQLDVEDPQE